MQVTNHRLSSVPISVRVMLVQSLRAGNWRGVFSALQHISNPVERARVASAINANVRGQVTGYLRVMKKHPNNSSTINANAQKQMLDQLNVLSAVLANLSQIVSHHSHNHNHGNSRSSGSRSGSSRSRSSRSRSSRSSSPRAVANSTIQVRSTRKNNLRRAHIAKRYGL